MNDEFNPHEPHDWFAAAGGLMTVALFVTAMVWVWFPVWWMTRTMVTEAIALGFFWFACSVTED